MNWQLLVVLAMLIAAVAMFAINRPRMDVVAVLVLVALPLTGVLTVPETLAGFADPNVVLIAALFVIGEGLSRTGLTYRLGDWLSARAGSSSTRLLVLLMLSVAVLGAFMSSTGVVAIFIPVVVSISARLGISPRMLMMPLSFAALISGMLTLIATAPNLVVDAELRRAGADGFGFFSVTPFGLVVLALGIGYMLVAGRFLGSDRDDDAGPQRRTYEHLIGEYRLADRERRLKVGRRSRLIGRSVEQTGLARDHGMRVIAIERRRWFQRRLEVTAGVGGAVLHRGDVLFVDVFGATDDLPPRLRSLGLEQLPLEDGFLTELSREVGLGEVILPPNSAALGRTVGELRTRDDHRVEVIGLRRGSTAVSGVLAAERVRLGDTLLVVGAWSDVQRLGSRSDDFVALELPAEVSENSPAANRAPFALLSVAVMVVLMVTGIVPNVIAALIACLLMGLFGCIDMPSAYRSIHWPTLLLIAGMLPFALALERTGGIDLAVSALTSTLGQGNPILLLAGLFITTAVIGLFVSNTATAVLMGPVAIATADHLGASPLPFAMVVVLAASAAFMTPVSSPVNTLVLGPGRYRFADFLKIGTPFTVVVLIVAVTMVPWLLPLYPNG
ncbi:TRAP transporter large permease subunit [Agromyces intestinalis]|uniref:TRAP transporter large permease subunit n=1 Tax=Agromyces intestinalis TaxID=2592652 RepID=A0A5C1YDR3_9MICO|nr:SLC13 family permease [Agromyces intestinalis]QEO13778.1 TRAP transporter large permease subunit [Agromyces intestinalis]